MSMNQTLEQKAQSASEKALVNLRNRINCNRLSLDAIQDGFKKCYLQGAKEALASQWISVEDQLPPEGEFVLCRMKSNDAIVGGFITKQFSAYPMVSTYPSFHFEDWGRNEYECSHWLRLPESLKPSYR